MRREIIMNFIQIFCKFIFTAYYFDQRPYPPLKSNEIDRNDK